MRNAEFNREQVLRQAMTAFMQKGYGKTSMPDLTKATGLHPGSIYCAFNNKRGLLLAAVEQYQQDRNQQLIDCFSAPRPIMASLKAYLDNLVAECVSCDASKACLLTKTLNELAEQDEEIQQIVTTMLEDWQQFFAKQFSQAKDNGELNPQADPIQLARYLVMGIYGIRTYAHTHPQPQVLQQLADTLHQHLS